MDFHCKQMYSKELPAEVLREAANHQARLLLDKGLGAMARGAWYAIRLTEEDFHELGGYGLIKSMHLDIQTIPDKKLYFVSPEDIYLVKTETKLIPKLKNCIAYLRDKTGGEWREERFWNE